MTSAHFTSVADFSGLQYGSLPIHNTYAGEEEGYEEIQAAVDLSATLARVERHRADALSAAPSPAARYEAYVHDALTALGLEYHTAAEIIAPHKRVTSRGVRNTLPPLSLLPRLLILALVMDEERRRAGFAVRKNSIYRAPVYNAGIGGAPLGQHPACAAYDSAPVGGSVRALQQVQEAMEGTRVVIAPHQLDVILRVMRDAQVRGVFSGPIGR